MNKKITKKEKNNVKCLMKKFFLNLVALKYDSKQYYTVSLKKGTNINNLLDPEGHKSLYR